MSRLDRASCASERIYRRLLVAYPKDFREEYGPKMVQAFRDLCREEINRAGVAGLARLWVRTVLDLISTVLAQRVGRATVDDEEVSVNDYKLAGLGFVLLLAPLFFVAASLLKYGLGVGFLFDPLDAFLSDPRRLRIFNLLSPVVFLGGSALAVIANLYAVLRLDFGREDSTVVSTVRLEMKLANIAVILVSLLLFLTLVGYAFLENFAYRS